MKNKKKRIIGGALALLLTVCIVVTALNMVALWQMKRIVPGMTKYEVIELMGTTSSKLSGAVRTEWRLANGDIIWVTFRHSEETGEIVVAGYFIE